jgi:uncharacterized protein (TIGR02117 family)
MNIIFPIAVLFLNTSPAHIAASTENEIDDSQITLYLVKQRWHTGLVIETSRVDTTLWHDIKDFQHSRHIDVGWGDAAFYQYPDFDVELAIKALFFPTPSALRIEGFNFPVREYLEMCDVALELKVSEEGFRKICKFIQNTYHHDEDENFEILSSRFAGNIKFYRANGKYHIFNTCNTWMAECLAEGGIKIHKQIVLAEQLFREAEDIGRVVYVRE